MKGGNLTIDGGENTLWTNELTGRSGFENVSQAKQVGEINSLFNANGNFGI